MSILAGVALGIAVSYIAHHVFQQIPSLPPMTVATKHLAQWQRCLSGYTTTFSSAVDQKTSKEQLDELRRLHAAAGEAIRERNYKSWASVWTETHQLLTTLDEHHTLHIREHLITDEFGRESFVCHFRSLFFGFLSSRDSISNRAGRCIGGPRGCGKTELAMKYLPKMLTVLVPDICIALLDYTKECTSMANVFEVALSAQINSVVRCQSLADVFSSCYGADGRPRLAVAFCDDILEIVKRNEVTTWNDLRSFCDYGLGVLTGTSQRLRFFTTNPQLLVPHGSSSIFLSLNSTKYQRIPFTAFTTEKSVCDFWRAQGRPDLNVPDARLLQFYSGGSPGKILGTSTLSDAKNISVPELPAPDSVHEAVMIALLLHALELTSSLVHVGSNDELSVRLRSLDWFRPPTITTEDIKCVIGRYNEEHKQKHLPNNVVAELIDRELLSEDNCIFHATFPSTLGIIANRPHIQSRFSFCWWQVGFAYRFCRGATISHHTDSTTTMSDHQLHNGPSCYR